MKKEKYTSRFFLNLLTDIRFWILVFFILHLSTITVPPLEPGSTWRQTDGLTIARNFYERDANIFFPTVDVAGEKSGITGSEFPILNYSIYLVSVVFGYEHWYGRLINLIISSLGIYFFFKLIQKYFNADAAFTATILVLVSIWFVYCRTNIPDTFAASLCIISLYYGLDFLETGKIHAIALFFVLGLFGTLAKISSACILAVLAIPFFGGSSHWRRKLVLALFSSVILISLYCWYFVWVPYINERFEFGGHFFMGLPIKVGIQELMNDLPWTLKRFYDTPLKFSGFFAFLLGLYLVIKHKLWLQLLIFAIPFGLFLIVILKSGWGFQINPYYSVMLIPPMAFVAGCGLAQLGKKVVVTILLLIVSIEGIGNRIHILKIREPSLSMVKLEGILDGVTKKDDLIVINGTAPADPTPMYFAHRRGWVVTNNKMVNMAYLEQLKALGCKYAVIAKKMYGDVTLSLPIIYDSDHFKVYQIP